MLQRLIHALIDTRNEAADDVLLEALELGDEREQAQALDALLRRKTVRGLSGVVAQFEALPPPLQQSILDNIKQFHPALRESGRSQNPALRLAAMKLIALGRQGSLTYVLSESLHDVVQSISKAAMDAMMGLAEWSAYETRDWQRTGPTSQSCYDQLMEQRPEIEAAVARALNVHRGRHGQDLLRAALLLCDWPGSKTLAILHTTKHGGQSPMVRRLQQPPTAEHVEAFLLGASHGQLRTHFGIVFSHINEAPVLDALLRKTHWLKDHQLQLCMHQVTRGTWWTEDELLRDIDRRPPQDAARIGEWLTASGIHDVMQDAQLEKLRQHAVANDDFAARLRLLRIAARRKRGASVQLLRSLLSDPDERIVRMAAREILRRRPIDFENILLQLMTTAPHSVRRLISRAIGHAGFDQFWQRFDRMDRATRRQAGRAMLKLLPDAVQRVARRLSTGPVEQRIKAMQVVQELGLADTMRSTLTPLCSHPNAKVRSKAVGILGDMPAAEPDVLLETALNDNDPRVRANAIEVLEAKRQSEFLPLLTERARSSHNRERANAIKAMHRMKVRTASTQLLHMLRDQRPEHRISALWALRQIGWWQLLEEVGKLARLDESHRVRRYALGVLRNVAEVLQETKQKGQAG
jgi:HEAT repeat protein